MLIDFLVAATLMVSTAASQAASHPLRLAAPPEPPATAEAPGLLAVVGLAGLVKAKDHFVPVVVAAAQNLTIPGAQTSQFHYDTIRVASCSLNSSSVSFDKTSQNIVLTLTDLGLSIGNTNFEVIKSIKPFGHLHCSGHFSAAITHTDVAMQLRVVNADGMPQVVATTSIDFGSVDVSHSMSHESCKIAEKIVEVFIGNINKKIESEVKSKIPGVVQNALNNEVNKLLAGLGLVISVDSYAQANFNLSGTPTITDTQLALGFQAKFEAKAPPPGGIPPTPEVPPPMLPHNDKDLALAFSASVFDTASAVYTALGVLELNETIPENVSASLRLILPQLRRAYATQPLVVHLAANSRLPPRVVFGPAGTQLVAENVSIVLSAVDANGTVCPALSLLLDASINATVALGPGAQNITFTVVPGLAQRTLGVTLAESWIGPIPELGPLATLVNFVCDRFGIPYINNHASGLPIPQVRGILLSSPGIVLGNGDVVVSTDIGFDNGSITTSGTYALAS